MALLAVILAVLLAGDPLAEHRDLYRSAAERTDFDAARRAAEEIARIGGDEAAAFLQSEFEKATQPPLRNLLFRALTLLDRPTRKDFLLEHLGADEPYFRGTALEALATVDRALAAEKALTLLDVDEDVRVRSVAAEVLGEVRGPRACGALLRAAHSLPGPEQAHLLGLLRNAPASDLSEVAELASGPDPRLRALALVALGGADAEPFRKLFEAAQKDADPVVALAGAAALDHMKTPGRSPSVRQVLTRVTKADDRYRLYELLANLPLRDPELTEALRRAVTSGSDGLRARAAETLGPLAGEGAVATLGPLLERGTSWTLSVGAARGLALTRCAPAVDALIAGLEGKRGRLAHEIAAALESLTGQAFGLNPDLWSVWWRQHGGGFQVAARGTPRWEEPRAFRDRYAFYGVEIRSESVVFVVDVSGSMQGEPMAKLKKELEGAIRAMPETTRFNLVPFDTEARAWSKKMVPAKGNGRKAALAYVEKLEVGGATNMWDGLQLAIADPHVDTIVLLSDGEPNTGAVTGMGEVRRRFVELNRERMILVHAIAIGMSSPDLKALAQQTGGTYGQR